ncbi:MAG: hypothetical protein M0R32_02665 [Candidatus Cloacimonetes bacterium]|jgi:hypothetical protein|nr:hypothetical protein [Candidatus Cloacimonadota bacterium]
MKTIVIQRNYGDGEPLSAYIIGAVKTDKTENQIVALWYEWQERNPHPDCDSEFIDWLIKFECCEPVEDFGIACINDC